MAWEFKEEVSLKLNVYLNMYILNMFVSLNLRETNISFFRIEKNDLESAVDLLKSWQISRELINH